MFVSVNIPDRLCGATLTLITYSFVQQDEYSNFSDWRHDGVDDCSFVLLKFWDFCSDFGKKKILKQYLINKINLILAN